MDCLVLRHAGRHGDTPLGSQDSGPFRDGCVSCPGTDHFSPCPLCPRARCVPVPAVSPWLTHTAPWGSAVKIPVHTGETTLSDCEYEHERRQLGQVAEGTQQSGTRRGHTASACRCSYRAQTKAGATPVRESLLHSCSAARRANVVRLPTIGSQFACHRHRDREIARFPPAGVLDYSSQCSRMLSSSARVQQSAPGARVFPVCFPYRMMPTTAARQFPDGFWCS